LQKVILVLKNLRDAVCAEGLFLLLMIQLESPMCLLGQISRKIHPTLLPLPQVAAAFTRGCDVAVRILEMLMSTSVLMFSVILSLMYVSAHAEVLALGPQTLTKQASRDWGPS
jgi:hypothetical protein